MIYYFKCVTDGKFEISMSMREDSSHCECPICGKECERDYDNINVNVATCFNGSYNSTRK